MSFAVSSVCDVTLHDENGEVVFEGKGYSNPIEDTIPVTFIMDNHAVTLNLKNSDIENNIALKELTNK